MPRSDRSFVDQFGFLRSASGGAHRCLQRGDLGVVTPTQHFETTFAIGSRLEMMVAPRPVTTSVARLHMVDLAIASRGIAALARAAVLCTAFGRGAGEAPNVVALPGASARVTAPRATSSRDDHRVTPLTASGFAFPCREMTGDSFDDERR